MSDDALELAEEILWGTYGLGAVEAYEDEGTPLPPITWKRLGDLDTDHLEAIIAHMAKHPERYTVPNLMTVSVTLVLENRRDYGDPDYS